MNGEDSIFYSSFKNQLLPISSGEMCLLSITVFVSCVNERYSAVFPALQLTTQPGAQGAPVCPEREGAGGYLPGF